MSFVVLVNIKVKPECVEDFIAATKNNCENSIKEAGIVRFDFIQDSTDPTKFVLIEAYKDSDKAPVAHKQTKHYEAWRDKVESMMAEPRSSTKWKGIVVPE